MAKRDDENAKVTVQAYARNLSERIIRRQQLHVMKTAASGGGE